MPRYFFHIGYHGKQYRGWQRQPGATASVQEMLEDTLHKMLGQKTTCIGCGRTDAEVHASQYFFHIDVEQEWTYDPVFRLNKMLPDDLAIFEVLPMPDQAHARYDATWRTYDYFIHRYKDPFLAGISAYYPLENLDLDFLKTATNILQQQTDFRAVCKRPDIYKHTLCNVAQADFWIDESQERLRFQIKANRFVRGMVRLSVAKLLEVATGHLPLNTFKDHLSNRTPFQFMNYAYPQGLYLSKVEYPYLERPPRSSFLLGSETHWRKL